MTILDIILPLITVIFLIYTYLRENMATKERHELLDRIMSRNYVEYKDNIKVEENEIKSQETEIVDLEQAKDDLV